MPFVSFTPALQRFHPTPAADVAAVTVGEALGAVFADHPALRRYVLDDQGEIRRHIAIYLNGARVGLSASLDRHDEVFVFQALTGG